MPRNGVRTVSPGLLHRSMHRSITSSCSGEIWRSSSLSRPPRYCSVRDWFMSIQTGDAYRRSEEHTSELQSLMRISYAVFCLKKKKTYIINTLVKSDQVAQQTIIHK